MLHKIIFLPRLAKQTVVVIVDCVFMIFATWLAYCLRLDEWHSYIPQQKYAYLLSPALAVPIFIWMGVYKNILRFSGAHTAISIAKAALVYSLIYCSFIFALASPYIYKSIGILQPLILFVLMVLARVAASFILEGLSGSSNERNVVGKLLIYGAGASAIQIASALRHTHQYSLVGYVDDTEVYHGGFINGLKVFSRTDIPNLVEHEGVTDILLALPSISRLKRNQIIQELRGLRVHVRTLPDLSGLAQGNFSTLDIKDLNPDDLLGRDVVEPDLDLMGTNIRNKVVLVTGAGGSIGSELCRQALKCNPKKLILFDHSEYNLYAIEAELVRVANSVDADPYPMIVAVLGSVREPIALEALFSEHQIDTVYHAAAYKHVPIVEKNLIEGVLNNTIGTLNLVNASKSARVKNFVLISTDKAVRPTNVMGATKRYAELILQAISEIGGPSDTIFCMVRFGNVLDSSGSVVPHFRRQIQAGGPITLTHLDVTRYFMTIPEAAQLVIQAGALAVGGEVFVLDMGGPVKIMDLARRMVELSGLTLSTPDFPDGDIELIVTGLRPGEKLYEELLIGENPALTKHPKIMMAKEEFYSWETLISEIDVLRKAAACNDQKTIIAQFQKLIHGFTPSTSPSSTQDQ